MADLNDGLVSILPLRHLRPVRGASFWSRRILPAFVCFLALLVSAGYLLAACDSGTNSSEFSNPNDAAVIAGWKAALNAADTAALTANAADPDLETTHTQPELGIVQMNLKAERAAGAVAIGHDRVLDVRVIRVVDKRASIAACVEGNEIVIFALTRKPVPGPLGETGLEGIDSTLVDSTTGWKVEHQSVSQGRCSS
jgi:hypothetical protein